MTDYGKYKATGMERVQMMAKALALTTGLAVLFYKSIWAVFLFSPFSIFLVKYQEKQKAAERRWELNQQFRQGLLGVSASLNAGYSVENAFGEAVKDLLLLYPEDADIIKEFQWIAGQIALNVTVEEVLQNLAQRTKIEDVVNFAEIFQTAKRTGGDIMRIIEKTGKNIGERIEIQREMDTVIAQKKLEATIMSIVPLGMILYMWLVSPGFLDALYHNLMGCSFMTVMLAIYLVAYAMMQKIADVRL